MGVEFWCLDYAPGADRLDLWEELLSETHLSWSVRVPRERQKPNYRTWVRRQWIDDLALLDCECGPCAASRGRAELSGTDGESRLAPKITRSASLIRGRGDETGSTGNRARADLPRKASSSKAWVQARGKGERWGTGSKERSRR